MTTDNCLYCEKVNENMKGKLVIETKLPDGLPLKLADGKLLYDYVCVSDDSGLFNVKLGMGSTFIYNILEEMNIYAHMNSAKRGKTESVKIKPNEFYHFIIEYDYYYFQNQPRIKGVRWQRVKHISQEQLYDLRGKGAEKIL